MLLAPDRGAVLNITFADLGVTELVQSATSPSPERSPVQRLWQAVPVFPALGEVRLGLLEAYRGR
ncbi:hypothetical protein ACPCJT_07430 [Streptomyces griseoincarnatus]